jgi:hypothetical protein
MLLRPNRLALLGLVACAHGPDDLGCFDAACREEIILEAHDGSPTEVPGHLAALSDDLERIAVISALVDHDPEGAQVYCSLIPRGISRRRCEHVAQRSHLWTPTPTAEPAHSRAGPGPVRSVWLATDVPPSELIHTRGVKGGLTQEVDSHATAWGRAIAAASSGAPEVAAKACSSIMAGQRWRYDCFFSTAVAYVQAWDRAHLDDTLALCGASGDYRGLCLAAVIDELAGRSPGSDVGDPLDWAPVMMRAHDLRLALADTPLALDAMDRFWSLVAAHSTAKATAMSGDALDALPAAAAPHVRAAIAAKVLGAAETPLDLGAAVQLVSTVLSRRAMAEAFPKSAISRAPVADLWPSDRRGESHLAAVSYLGASRRTVAADPGVDTMLVVLEAAARLEPPWASMLNRAKTDRDQRVRWTAVRLEEQLGAAALGVGSAPLPPGHGGQN